MRGLSIRRLNQGASKLVDDRSRIRHGAWIPRVPGTWIPDSLVAVKGGEHHSLEAATIAALGREEQASARVASPDAILERPVGNEPQPVQVPDCPAASRTEVEKKRSVSAWQRPMDHADPAADPPGSGNTYRVSIEPCHAEVVGQPAVVGGPEDEVRPAARVFERPARRRGRQPRDGFNVEIHEIVGGLGAHARG